MDYKLYRHAQTEAVRRQIPSQWVEAVLATPEQQVEESDGKIVLQSRFASGHGKIYPVRAIVAIDKRPPVVVTIYRTSTSSR